MLLLRILPALLLVAALGINSQFARFTSGAQSEDAARVAKMSCSYELTSVPALSFLNSEYWLTLTGSDQKYAVNIPEKFVFTVKNYQVDSEGKTSICEVAMSSTARFYVEKELAKNMAFQLVRLNNATKAEETYYPQVVVSDMEEPSTLTVGKSNKNTFGQLGEPEDVTLEVTGALANGGKIVAKYENNEVISISQSTETAQYSIGFLRGHIKNVNGEEIISNAVSPLYIDFEITQDYYLIDINLPHVFQTGVQQEYSYALYVTPTENLDQKKMMDRCAANTAIKIDNHKNATILYYGDDEATGIEQPDGMTVDEVKDRPVLASAKGSSEALISLQKYFLDGRQDGTYGENDTFDGAKVIGFHYDITCEGYTVNPEDKDNLFDADGTVKDGITPTETTVRVECRYDYNEIVDGKPTITSKYYHVAVPAGSKPRFNQNQQYAFEPITVGGKTYYEYNGQNAVTYVPSVEGRAAKLQDPLNEVKVIKGETGDDTLETKPLILAQAMSRACPVDLHVLFEQID